MISQGPIIQPMSVIQSNGRPPPKSKQWAMSWAPLQREAAVDVTAALGPPGGAGV